jgi:signal transduction histidine kinase
MIDNSLLHADPERQADAARALVHVDEAVVLVDGGGDPRYWNPAADDLLGSGLRGWKAVRRLLPTDEQPEAAVTVPVELPGGERWLEISRSALQDGAVYAVRDVTDERLLERTRREFVATASHELRTPIAAIYGAFRTLLRDDVEIDRSLQERILRSGLQETERLWSILEDLLVAGELDTGTPQIERGRCDVVGLVLELAEATLARIDGSHRLALELDPGIGELECDARRLRQVVANLLENAAKYSPGGSTITVSASRADGMVRIEVADEGIGIAQRDQARVFERFVRLDPDQRRGVGGTGLGLYICRELLSRMHGRIRVRSREGVGSTFVVELPA